MKIAVPAEGTTLGVRAASVFGRCPFFVIYDTETATAIGVPNPGADAPGGAGIAAATFLVDEGVDLVLAPEVGPKARRVLDGAKLAVAIHHAATVKEALAVRERTPTP